MKLKELRKINKLYFGYEEVARILGIAEASARVSASRYVKQGLLIRLKKNMYVLEETWDKIDRKEKFQLANLGQTPSYISLTTALDYYELTTQVQRDFFESVAVKRSKEVHLNGTVFRYSKLSKSLYFGFKKEQDFFIATPEKALLDAVYLLSFGRYALDIAALDTEKFDHEEMENLSGKFPLKTINMLKRYGYLKPT